MTIDGSFSLKRVTLKVIRTGSGVVTSAPVGIKCGSRCAGTFDWGKSVRMTAKPLKGYLFAGWGNACTGKRPVCVVTPKSEAATLVAARFVKAKK
jgi:hypothetical protein